MNSSQVSSSTHVASAAEEEDPFSLDFTQPAGKPAVAPPAAKPLELALEPLEAQAAQAPQEPRRASAGSLPEQETAGAALQTFPRVHLEPVAEQAVLHYARGEMQAARQTLEDAMQLADSSEYLWWLLFDLYRRLHDQAAFEQLSLRFAERFEKSPPSWQSPGDVAMRAREQQTTANRATVALTGVLSARSAAQFARLLEVAQTRSQLRLDLARLQGADEGGCQLLLDLDNKLKMTACTLQFDGIETMLPRLASYCQSGQAKHASIWLLRLDFLQRLGRLDEFEALALDYAITFEVSPPSWVEAAIVAPAIEEDLIESVQALQDQGAHVQYHGELLALTPADFEYLITVCRQADAEGVMVDFSGVQRMDPSSAQALHSALQTLADLAGRIHWQGCTALLTGLLEMAGIAELTQLKPGK